MNVATDMNSTVEAANDIARLKAVLISKFDEYMDLYVSSQLCRSFLISAVTSTFGWWLAFFAYGQNAIYYMPDERIQVDKVPDGELFLKTWQQYKG
ncbi:hypothetical protein Y032_0200g1707 [Ancylostoma ceylanicum]|nr:hypothetical protein Y032_0200g1707 [Ancylostoma ceylanicum]